MDNCCKAYLLRQLRELSQWSEQMENARQTAMPVDATFGEADRTLVDKSLQEPCNDTDTI
jgi:hypothetical protein